MARPPIPSGPSGRVKRGRRRQIRRDWERLPKSVPAKLGRVRLQVGNLEAISPVRAVWLARSALLCPPDKIGGVTADLSAVEDVDHPELLHRGVAEVA